MQEIENLPTERPHPRRLSLLQVLSVMLIIGLSLSTWSVYSSNQILNSELSAKQSQIQTLQTTIGDQQSQIETLQTYIQVYFKLFDSNITPPVSKIEAVGKALSRGGWNSSTLSGMEVEASLIYVRFFTANKGGSRGWETLGSVTKPVDDYSPRAEFNVTEPGAYPIVVGTMTYRYVWAVIVQQSSGLRSIPPPGLYWVDASTGELFEYTGIGFESVK